MSTERRVQFESMIRRARTRLSLTNTDTMARRGVFLIDTLLQDSPQREDCDNPLEDATSRPKFYQILERFLQHDRPAHAGDTGAVDGAALSMQGFDDFDIWYNQTFG